MISETVLYSAVAALSGAIVHLYVSREKRSAKTEAELDVARGRLDACEVDRNNFRVRIAALESGCGLAECPLRQENG